MNREIKFEYGFLGVNGIIKKKYTLAQIQRIAQICDVWDELPLIYVRQFTGLKDKNGKEIYEGDVLNIGILGLLGFGFIKNQYGDNAIYIVESESIDYTLKRVDLNITWGRLSRLDEMGWQCEVIGNIYENPELLQA